MRCNHCHSLMLETATVREGQSEQTWYECPVCGRTHLYSRCLPHHETRDKQPRRDADSIKHQHYRF